MAEWVFMNDEFVSEQKALLHFTDLSFQRGYGVFDFFRLQENKPLFLKDHLNRFYASAHAMHLHVPINRAEIENISYDLIKRNDVPNAGIRLSLTGGYSADAFVPGKPNLIISQHSFSIPSKVQQQAGVALLSHSYQRQMPQVKTIDYLMAIWLQPLRLKAGADDILYHSNGSVTECPRSNFFLVTEDNHIVTPAENILKGVTRAKVLQLANEAYVVEERAVHFDEIKTAREAFITSTTKQILPVAKIDDKVFTERKISNDLLNRFHAAYGY